MNKEMNFSKSLARWVILAKAWQQPVSQPDFSMPVHCK